MKTNPALRAFGLAVQLSTAPLLVAWVLVTDHLAPHQLANTAGWLHTVWVVSVLLYLVTATLIAALGSLLKHTATTTESNQGP